jgi:hypothetical protein
MDAEERPEPPLQMISAAELHVLLGPSRLMMTPLNPVSEAEKVRVPLTVKT